MIEVKRDKKKFIRDSKRVITKLHIPSGENRISKIIKRVIDLPEQKAEQALEKIIADFSLRHKNIWNVFDRHFNEIKGHIPENSSLSDKKRALLGAYFTLEYSIQSAAFFNPSIVPHPNQKGLKKGSLRFILTFRSIGEGHISSIEFRSGVVDINNKIKIDPVSSFVETPERVSNPLYDKHTFQLKWEEMRIDNSISKEIFEMLSDQFYYSDLQAAIRFETKKAKPAHFLFQETIDKMNWLAESNYELQFGIDQKLTERVIFPGSHNDSNGIEDARFVRFVNDNGSFIYYATYTAYNGHSILPQILETKDFLTFRMKTLNGKAVINKGMALFPRKIKGKYMMISRIDGENLFIMSSKNIHFWENYEILQEPIAPWEFIQIGNCGSPIETEKGWLLLTHGVGPMRQYWIGAILLDLNNPSKVIGWLREPLLRPNEEEREGYVPNVVYTCGGLIHNGELILPYASSDISSSIVTVPIAELFDNFENPPMVRHFGVAQHKLRSPQAGGFKDV